MYIGIDYGTKRVGIAVSSENNAVAFPLEVVAIREALARLVAVAQERKATGFVIGESKNFAGEDNPLMQNIADFVKELEAQTNLPIFFEPEFLTSAAAARQFDGVQSERGGGERNVLDASAAALLLQSFLDKGRRS